ncbi:DUF6923 family protein [Bacteroidota bacterium]
MMKTTLKSNYFNWNTTIILLLFTTFLNAQEEPFDCDYNAYLFQYNDVYALDLASGSSYLVKEDIIEDNINAVGYNPKDGYIWGAISNNTGSIIKIGKNFQTEVFNIPEIASAGNMFIGDVSADGFYYLKLQGSNYYVIDVNPESDNYGKYVATRTLLTDLTLPIHDWAFNAVDGMLYTVTKKTNVLYRINPETGEVTDLGEVPILSGLNYHFGAVYFDSEGRFYISANQTGTVYVVNNVQNLNNGSTMESNLFAFGPSSNSNDGARCPTAPVPQEDCINGIDDDGDGLVDCDDPACSGVAACPVLVPVVSSGNDGGLESNDRLSQQINQRNYMRSKNSYKFSKKRAKKVAKGTFYKMAKSNGNFGLIDLIPLSVLPETTAIESSPADLIAMTNATELFSVDYMKNNETVAVVLASVTEEGVYEHTKYICDRLLGSELLAVSTIEINEVTFIKSIIKNVDGSIEFVLSFSGRLNALETAFEIDSHWNIDKYIENEKYYNFQIWTNKIDDLVLLGEEVLSLFEAQHPISAYNNSAPPPVFVKKGKYVNGTIELELVNTNSSNKIQFDAGFKRTETSETESISEEIALEPGYITNMTLATGALFDIGFRIQNDTGETSDDLFMSDGPWGLDSSQDGTVVEKFEIKENEAVYTGQGLRIERDLSFEVKIKSYVSAYRAFTPRFRPVDLSGFNVLEFDANGTGELHITIVKESVSDWEAQYKTTIPLDGEDKHYQLPLSYFTSSLTDELVLDDAVSIVFTMESDGKLEVQKKIDMKNIAFESRDVEDYKFSKDKAVVFPNPVSANSFVRFYTESLSDCEFSIYNITGALVKKITPNTSLGFNEVALSTKSLIPGIYYLKVSTDNKNFETVTLMVD